MIALDSYLAVIAARAQVLAPVIAIAYLLGGVVLREVLMTLAAHAYGAVTALGRKLDRENRGVATLVYRGIVAVLMLVVPALVVGMLLSKPLPWVQLLSALGLFVWFGHCFATVPTFALLKRARADGLPLQVPGLPYLFADSHAVIRHLMVTRMDAFAVGVVGGCFWYVLGGWILMLPYLALAAAALAYRQRLAFGWAARGLFALMDFLPRLIARALLALAALFTPHARPIAGAFAPSWRAAVANTLDCALGGSSPHGEQPWVGTGTARVTQHHLRRAMVLLLAATVLLVLLLASPIAYKLLINFM